jgi:predicted amino acid-binding ACT domain protein
MPASAFSGARIQRVHGGDARPAGTVFEDRGGADGQQSQYPVGANHDARRRSGARRVPRSHLGDAGAIALDEDRWPRVERDLERLVSGELDITALVAEAQKARFGARKFVRRVATEVTIDNRTSEESTVVDVFTQDRVGLLFTITHTLFELGMKIHLARISTNADQALDVFYISDSEGNKVTDLERMRSIKAAAAGTARRQASGGHADGAAGSGESHQGE